MWIYTLRTCAAVAEKCRVKDAILAVNAHGDLFGGATVELTDIGNIVDDMVAMAFCCLSFGFGSPFLFRIAVM
jgi:hypothetical protein